MYTHTTMQEVTHAYMSIGLVTHRHTDTWTHHTMVRLLNSTVEPILSSLLIVVIVTVVLSRVVQSRVLCESRDKQTRGLPQTQPPPQGCLPILVMTVGSHTHTHTQQIRNGKGFFLYQLKNRLKNFADVSIRVLWSFLVCLLTLLWSVFALKKTRGLWSKRRQGFQPIFWYRRALYCSCNSQLRSSHFTTDQCLCNGAVLKQGSGCWARQKCSVVNVRTYVCAHLSQERYIKLHVVH